MKQSAVIGIVITAALAAVLLSRASKNAMTDAANAGSIASDGAETPDAAKINQGAYDMSNQPTRLSPAGLGALKAREGFSPTPYPDFKGFSIGYGHLIKADEDLPSITEPDAAALLMQDVEWAENAVRGDVNVPLTQNQFDALVSFVFNVGRHAFETSTLLARLNAGDLSAADEFARWNRAGGNVSSSLIARRESELQQFEA